MKKMIVDKLEIFVLLCIVSFIFTSVAIYEVFKFLLYPASIIRRQIRFRDKKTTYYVAYDRAPIFGSELYITKHNIVLSELECWFSGTFKECFEFLEQDTKETQKLLKTRKLLQDKKCNANEFFYDNEFNDYDDDLHVQNNARYYPYY